MNVIRTGPPDHHELVRRTNESMVLSAIIEHAPVSRSKLVEITGLSKPTVLRIVSAHLENKLIRTAAGSTSGAGRPADYYEANPKAGFAIGIDLGGTKVRAALCDLIGRIIEETTEPTDHHGGMAVVAQIERIAKSLAKTAKVPWRLVQSVAIGSPGYVADDGTLAAAANIAGLETIALRRVLERSLRVHVVVENDVNAAAFGEFASGSFGSIRNLAVISIGTGVGAGIIVDGQVMRGSRGAAGEIAYLPLGDDPTSTQARLSGSLELAASGSGMRRALRHALSDSHEKTSLKETATPAQIFTAAASGDALARELIEQQAALIARAVLSIAVVCDPDVFVLAGGIGANPTLLDPVRAAVAAIAPFPIRIERSAFADRSGLLGATALARQHGWHMLFPADEA